MARKRLTQLFPFLIPLRKWQRKRWYYRRMERDGNRYAAVLGQQDLPAEVFRSSCPMINRDTGWPLVYQRNTVFNLRLAARCLDGLLLRPGETFSFWHSVRFADRDTPYREGLAEIDGKLTAQYGGGLCMLSNLLFWIFCNGPLTVTERWGHDVKDFPEPESDAPQGVDATVAEGWQDLKARNDTQQTFQIRISFDESHITGRLLAERDGPFRYRAVNRDLRYVRRPDGSVWQTVDVCRRTIRADTGEPVGETLLYTNRCRIGYPLPAGTEIEEERA